MFRDVTCDGHAAEVGDEVHVALECNGLEDVLRLEVQSYYLALLLVVQVARRGVILLPPENPLTRIPVVRFAHPSQVPTNSPNA